MIETTHDSLAFNSTLNSRRHSDHRLQRDSLVSADTLIEFLESRLGVDKFDKEMLYSLTEKLRKDKDNKFAFQELLSICMSCLSSVKEKMDFSWSQLHKVLSEKQEKEKNVQKLKSAEKQRYGEALYEDLLRIKIWEVRDLVIASGQKVFIRISCDDITFSTRVHDYLTSTFEEAFYEFFVKKGLEKIKIQAILANEQEDILGELEIPVKGSNLEMEQDEWRVLTSVQDGISVCGEVRLSVKLVPLRGELTKGPIGEIEHKIKMQTEEVEGLEKIYKSFNIIISALKDYNSGNTVSYRNTVGDFNDERCLSSNGFVDRRISLGNEDQGLEGSGRKTYLKEKKRILPPLGFQKLDSARAVETVALKKEPTLKNSRQSGNPTKSEVCSQNYHSAPKLETSSVNQRNSLVNLLELFNSPVKDLGVNANQVKAFSAVKHQDSSEWEAEKREDSYQNQSSGSNDQANWKKENLRLNGIIRNLQEENKVLLNEIQKLKHTDQKVKECRDKMSVLIGELNRVQAIVKEKEEEVIHWKKQSEKNNSFDFEEIQGKIKKLVDENQRLRDIALKAHNESVYYKNQCESYGEGKNKIDSLLKEIEVLRTVNQNLNQEQIEKEEILQKLRRENVSLKQNNMTFSNELAKRDGLLERLKTEASTSHSTLNTRSSVKGNKGVTNENVYKLDSRKNQSYQPLQPWNFLNTEQ